MNELSYRTLYMYTVYSFNFDLGELKGLLPVLLSILYNLFLSPASKFTFLY